MDGHCEECKRNKYFFIPYDGKGDKHRLGCNIIISQLSMVNKLIGQWVNGSMSQWVNGSMGQWVNESISQ